MAYTLMKPYLTRTCVEIKQCVGCTRQFFTKSFLGDDAAVLAPSSGEEPPPPRYRAGVASMTWRSTRHKILISTQTRTPQPASLRPPCSAGNWTPVLGSTTGGAATAAGAGADGVHLDEAVLDAHLCGNQTVRRVHPTILH